MGHPGAEVGRHGRRISERLVVVGRDGRDPGQQVRGRDVILMVLGAEVARRDAGELHLVVALGLEADRVGGGGAPGRQADHAGDGGTVRAAAQEAGGLAAIELVCHGLAQKLPERLLFRAGSKCGGLVEGRHPIRGDRQFPVLEQRIVPGRQAEHVLEDRARGGYDVEIDVIEDCLRIQRRRVGRVDKCVGTQREAQFVTDDAIAQGADRESIHRQESAAGGLAQCDREFAIDLRRGVGASLPESCLPACEHTIVMRASCNGGIAKYRRADRKGNLRFIHRRSPAIAAACLRSGV